MSTEPKIGFLDKEMTRRQFMKISGKTLAGLTVSASLLSLFGCDQQQVDDGKVATWAMPQGLLIVNADRCTGCQRCELNCTIFNDGAASSYMSRIKVTRNLFTNKNNVGMLNSPWVFYPDTCRQCATPACGEACPVGAIYANDQGVKLVDEDKCIGCKACTNACPWHMPTVSPETNKSTKCIACGTCVKGCPTSALQIIDWDEVTAAAQLTYAG